MTRQAKSVLVVDDLESLRDLIGVFFEGYSYSVRSEKDAAGARQWLEKNVPLLIMLDVMLPDSNGFDLCRWIRAQKQFQKVPIIIMSAIKDDETAQDAFALGAVDFLRKPFELKTLGDKVGRFLTLEPQR